jgi:hypothetical protein
MLLAAEVSAGTVWIAMFCVGITSAQASDPAIDSTPDAVTAVASSSADNHILGVIPNYAAVNDPPKVFDSITAGEKFVIAAHDSFDPFNWVLAGVYGGVYQWQNDYRRFGQGAQGFAKRYGATFADGAISTYISEGILPSLLHEDPRYFRMGQGPKWRRAGYALTRVLITKNDFGASRFNNSEIEGNLLAASIANLYYPAADRSLGDTLQKFGINVLSDAGFNVLREFWPDMKHKVLHR